MELPNRTKAIIAKAKLTAYLLNPSHKRGGSKARKLLAMGYTADQWQRLEQDLIDQHTCGDVRNVSENEYGTTYEIVAALRGPNGTEASFRSIWQIDSGTEAPRLITLVPVSRHVR
jgi:hypothetical protein